MIRVLSDHRRPLYLAGTGAGILVFVLSPYLTLPVFRIWWHGEQKNEGGEPSPVGARASDAVEKRRKDKMLIARMLDMDEPFMTEKVRVTEKVRSN